MKPAFITPSVGHSTFLTRPIPHHRFQNVTARRSVLRYRIHTHCKALLPSEDVSESSAGGGGTSDPPSSDGFSGFAAGPTPSAPRRLKRPPAKEKDPDSTEEDGAIGDATVDTPNDTTRNANDEAPVLLPDSAQPDDQPAENTSDSSPAALEELRAVRALGTAAAKERAPFTQRKTAADFIAEGVVDDVDESSPFVPADIRFGIDDIKDPFQEDSDKEEEERIISEQQQLEDSVGQSQDVTGDGGVSKTLITVGSGKFVTPGADVRVEYTGKLDDGAVFDSSRKRGGGFSFTLGAGTVIKGWEAAIVTMRVGEVSEFSIAPQYAYGRRGMPPVIPGNATLCFEIELLESKGGSIEEVKNMPDFNPDVARTPEEIAKKYESRLATQEERKKNMTLLDRFYIISPFMSQTGEKPPWWINPNITFVLIAIFTVLGVYFVIKAGAVHIGFVDQPVDVNIFK